MEITEVRVYPVDEEKLKAYVTITFDHCFVIRDLKIIQGTNGLFVAMPSRKCKDGSFKDTAHPLNSDTRRMIEDRILGKYQEVLRKRPEPSEPPPPPPQSDSDSDSDSESESVSGGNPPSKIADTF